MACQRQFHTLRPVALVALLCAAGAAIADPLPRFPPGAVWNQNIATAPLHPQSADMIGTVADLGGFGLGRMQIDFSLHVVRAPADAPMRTVEAIPFDEYYSPDCEPPGTAMPVPANAAIEGETGLVCDNTDNDCHLLVVQGQTLYEAYRVTEQSSAQVQAQCLALWQMDAVYPPQGRGEHCTSADAAGFPMAPLMFNADDIAAALAQDATGNGDLGHAIRFILPNARMANDASLGGVDGRLYVRPASHAGGPSGPVDAVPYGSRLRLRADFPLEGYSPAARVILNTFKRYGIVLADGGNVALTAESDLYTTTKWADLGIGSRLFDQTPGAAPVAITDFAVIDTGGRIAETYDCARSSVRPNAGPPALGLTASQGLVTAGESLSFATSMANTSGAPVTFDVYLVALPPPNLSLGCNKGEAVVFLSDGPTLTPACRSAAAQKFPPLASGVTLAAGERVDNGNAFSATWPAVAPEGAYTFVLIATPPGALSDGIIGAGDLQATGLTIVNGGP